MKLLKKMVLKKLNTDTHEELRRIRTLILQKNEVKVIQFTNSIESKSVYQKAYELAESFSLINRKTVLVNLNLRNEGLFRDYFNNPSFTGLDAYFTEQTLLDDLVIPISENFDLITNKVIIPNSTDYLYKEKVSSLFENLRSEYDYVFVVTSSLHLCYDALILGNFSDGLIYIKEDRLPSKNILKKHATLLKQLKKPILGLIITNIDL